MWSSVYSIVARYVELQEQIKNLDHGSIAELELQPLLLTRCPDVDVEVLLEELDSLQVVTKELQHPTLTLSGKVERPDVYTDMAFAPPTSSICELFFSQAKHVLTDHHKKMDPETFEVHMLLSYNRSMWSVFAIDPIRESGVKIYQ